MPKMWPYQKFKDLQEEELSVVRRDGAEIRKERIQEVARFLQRALQNERRLSLSKTLALLQYEFGLTKEKLLEYLNILENLGQVVSETELDRIRRTNDEENE